MSITVTAVNDAPVATGDAFSTNEDTTLNVAAPGVLGNDTDTDADPLTAALVSDVAHGTLTLHANGSFDYTPAAELQRLGQLHVQGQRRHRRLEHGHGDDHREPA